MIRTARLQALSTFLPESILSNETLAGLYPGWSAEKIADNYLRFIKVYDEAASSVNA